MSIEDLRDIAAQLHKFGEEGGTHRAPTLQETHLLFKTALRAVMNWNLSKGSGPGR
jgi:hypothetical protein